ncbi:unnamed protein product [Amoebophrya sp. A120]|nr:unnamed protein product [Amoebophrya sp. A120]|eukprot:GSA120T00018851001.1
MYAIAATQLSILKAFFLYRHSSKMRLRLTLKSQSLSMTAIVALASVRLIESTKFRSRSAAPAPEIIDTSQQAPCTSTSSDDAAAGALLQSGENNSPAPADEDIDQLSIQMGNLHLAERVGEKREEQPQPAVPHNALNHVEHREEQPQPAVLPHNTPIQALAANQVPLPRDDFCACSDMDGDRTPRTAGKAVVTLASIHKLSNYYKGPKMSERQNVVAKMEKWSQALRSAELRDEEDSSKGVERALCLSLDQMLDVSFFDTRVQDLLRLRDKNKLAGTCEAAVYTRKYLRETRQFLSQNGIKFCPALGWTNGKEKEKGDDQRTLNRRGTPAQHDHGMSVSDTRAQLETRRRLQPSFRERFEEIREAPDDSSMSSNGDENDAGQEQGQHRTPTAQIAAGMTMSNFAGDVQEILLAVVSSFGKEVQQFYVELESRKGKNPTGGAEQDKMLKIREADSERSAVLQERGKENATGGAVQKKILRQPEDVDRFYAERFAELESQIGKRNATVGTEQGKMLRQPEDSERFYAERFAELESQIGKRNATVGTKEEKKSRQPNFERFYSTVGALLTLMLGMSHNDNTRAGLVLKMTSCGKTQSDAFIRGVIGMIGTFEKTVETVKQKLQQTHRVMEHMSSASASSGGCLGGETAASSTSSPVSTEEAPPTIARACLYRSCPSPLAPLLSLMDWYQGELVRVKILTLLHGSEGVRLVPIRRGVE